MRRNLLDYDHTDSDDHADDEGNSTNRRELKHVSIWFPKEADDLCFSRDEMEAYKRMLARTDPEDRPLRVGRSIDNLGVEE